MESLINDLESMNVSEKSVKIQEILGFYMPLSLKEWDPVHFNYFLHNINRRQCSTYYVRDKIAPFCWVYKNDSLHYVQWKDGYSFTSKPIKMDYGINQSLFVLEATVNSVIENKASV
mgnify:CR=1 FL=1